MGLAQGTACKCDGDHESAGPYPKTRPESPTRDDPARSRLWTRLRQRRDGLPAFRRQHPCGPFILDFYCPTLKLAIEVDGLIHATADAPERDARRDAWLASQGVEIVRYPASDVLRDADEVAHSIWTLVASRRR